MGAARVFTLAENTGSMTFAEGLAFIERTRRQLDRFDVLPHAPGKTIDLSEAVAIRAMCDKAEAEMRAMLGII